jgi:hypothetical protein
MRESARISGLIAIALLISPISFATDASADSNPQISPTADPYKTLLNQYRIDRDNYLNAMKERSQQIRVININFKSACDLAASNFYKEMSTARTPDQKNAAVSNRKNSIGAAIAARDLAITNLGAEPTPPVEPTKPMRVTKNR